MGWNLFLLVLASGALAGISGLVSSMPKHGEVFWREKKGAVFGAYPFFFGNILFVYLFIFFTNLFTSSWEAREIACPFPFYGVHGLDFRSPQQKPGLKTRGGDLAEA
jgi:hypothetical protein